MNPDIKATSALHDNEPNPPPQSEYLNSDEFQARKRKEFMYWMRASHYHCTECEAELIFIGRMRWATSAGVRAFGMCPYCSLVMIEYENALPKWIDLDKA